MSEKLPNGYVYETMRETIILVPFTMETAQDVKEQLEKDGFKIAGLHTFTDKRQAYRVHINYIAELETEILALKTEVIANKTRLAMLETPQK